MRLQTENNGLIRRIALLKASDEFINFLRKNQNGEKPGFISLSICREASRLFDISAREAEASALDAGFCPERYARNTGTLGMKGQARLLRSTAAVAGCGGLGGWLAEELARAGVGRLILIDGDSFVESNLNRQLFATEENLGKPKAEAAVQRIEKVNSAVETLAFCHNLDSENAEALLAGADLVLDALDSNSSRAVVFEACKRAGIPFVHGAVAGFYGQLSVLWPDSVPLWEKNGAEDKGIESETGNPAFIPPFIASAQCAEAVRILAGLGGELKEKLLWFDLESREMKRLKI